MNIRKRLFLSNIMMILIPAVLCAVLSYIILFWFTRTSDLPLERAFPYAFNAFLRYQRTGDMEELQESVDNFNSTMEEDGIFMALLSEHDFVYPDNGWDLIQESDSLLPAMLRSGATGNVKLDGWRISIEQMDEYRILVVDRMEITDGFRPFVRHIPMLFAAVLVVILLTNRLLTRILTRSITGPLDKLAKGARRLGDGELGYRISYRGKDEFATVCQDFNDMADHLQELIEYQTRNEENRKELLAGISHDLRTPLTSIRAYVEGLLDGVAEDWPAQIKYLNIIRGKAQDIDRIVDKLFLFSKLDIGDYPANPEPLDIGEELEAMARTVEEESGDRGISLILEEEVKGVFIHMDPVYLHNVLVNILENSMRYKTKEHCTVTIRCFTGEDRVTVWMTDDGPGVREDELEKLFRLFYRGDPSRQNPSKGSGLGLAISSRMMTRIGGDIRAENAPEGGLRVILEFPRYHIELTEGSEGAE